MKQPKTPKPVRSSELVRRIQELEIQILGHERAVELLRSGMCLPLGTDLYECLLMYRLRESEIQSIKAVNALAEHRYVEAIKDRATICYQCGRVVTPPNRRHQ